MPRKDIATYSYILRGKARIRILEKLSDTIRTQAQLHKETNMRRTHVRRTLLALEEKNLVKCLNPEDRIYKFYSLTESGKNVLKKFF